MKLKFSTILGITAMASAIGYLYLSKKDEDDTLAKLDGFSMNLKPDVLAESAMGMFKVNDNIKKVGTNLVRGFMAGRK